MRIRSSEKLIRARTASEKSFAAASGAGIVSLR
jgi:hypothetical protein